MLLTRKYHFYAAHRNQELVGDRCWAIHGHCYRVRITFDLEKKSSITTLFAELDAKVKPCLDPYDHCMLIDINDPLYAHLVKFEGSENFRFVLFDGPTSVENLAEKLYTDLRLATGLNICDVEVDETESSTLKFSTDNVNK